MTCAYCDAQITGEDFVCSPCTERFRTIENIQNKVAEGVPVETFAPQMLAMLAQDAVAFSSALATAMVRKPGRKASLIRPNYAADAAFAMVENAEEGQVFNINDLLMEGCDRTTDQVDKKYRQGFKARLLELGMKEVGRGLWAIAREDEQYNLPVKIKIPREPRGASKDYLEPLEPDAIEGVLDPHEYPEEELFWVEAVPYHIPDKQQPIERQDRFEAAGEVFAALFDIAANSSNHLAPHHWQMEGARKRTLRLLSKYGFLIHEIRRKMRTSHLEMRDFKEGLMKALAPEKGGK